MSGKTGLRRIVGAFTYSMQGLLVTFRSEAAFRQELVLVLVLIPVACVLNVSRIDRMLMISSLLLVLVVELINSAIESTINRIGPEQHTLSGTAKDQGSAAVLVCLLLAGFIWVSALWPLFAGS